MFNLTLGIFIGVFGRKIKVIHKEFSKPKGERIFTEFLDVGIIITTIIELIVAFLLLYVFTITGSNFNIYSSIFLGASV